LDLNYWKVGGLSGAIVRVEFIFAGVGGSSAGRYRLDRITPRNMNLEVNGSWDKFPIQIRSLYFNNSQRSLNSLWKMCPTRGVFHHSSSTNQEISCLLWNLKIKSLFTIVHHWIIRKSADSILQFENQFL
jgi:hypothetical protein